MWLHWSFIKAILEVQHSYVRSICCAANWFLLRFSQMFAAQQAGQSCAAKKRGYLIQKGTNGEIFLV